MKKQPKTSAPKTFYQLKNEWYKKLEQSGFHDLEYANQDLKAARPIPSEHIMASIREFYSGIWEYSKAQTLNKKHLDALTLLADGLSNAETAKQLSISRKTVYRILKAYKNWLGL